ncbi:hypothetical protein GGH95_000519 [Coemansia sp. RSA 1836]|nr:hypothetical protein GGH95_000519 [Coemansia sp. RSA 1836]
MAADKRHSRAFPVVTWPLHLSESGVGYTGTDAFDLGTFGHMLPSIASERRPGDPQAAVSWRPASAQPQPETYNVVTEPGSPVIMRPSTRIAQFLDPGRGHDSAQLMYKSFSMVHRDLDIPKDILCDALTEALDESDWDHIASKRGNVMACCRPTLNRADIVQHAEQEGRPALEWLQKTCYKRNVRPITAPRSNHEYRWSSHRMWAFYPGGTCNSELWTLPLPTAEDQHSDFSSLRYRGRESKSMRGVEAGPSIEFARTIRQIATRESHPGYACIRTDNMVGLLSLVQRHQPPDWVPRVEVDVVGSPYLFDQGDMWICHASWSPWTVSEIALASGTGCIRLWDCNAGRETELKGCDVSDKYDDQWNCCEYWNSPRTILCANPDTLYMLDARSGCSRTNIMSLTDSLHAAADELFTAACPSALHPMHAIAASTHYIRVFDQRYLAQPVVAWRHNLSTYDPPIYLQTCEIPQCESGQAAAILAASAQSSRVASYVYGQHGSDQPYASIEQTMLKSSTKSARISEDIQDLLALDLKESPDMTICYTYISSHLTSQLSGLSLQLLPREPGATLGDSVGEGSRVASKSVDAVCMTIDESGAVVGRRLLLIPRSERKIGSKPGKLKSSFNPVFKAPIWTNFCPSQGAVVDGMGLLLYDKARNDERKESFWAELRKRGISHRRVDMREPYRCLLKATNTMLESDSANGLEPSGNVRWSAAFATQLGVVARQAAANVSGLDLANWAIGALSNAPHFVMQSELPSWSASGEGIRDAFLSMRDGELDGEEVADRIYSDAIGAINACQPLLGTSRSESYSELERIFGTLHSSSNVHVTTALARAAKDIDLADVRVRSVAASSRQVSVSRGSTGSDILSRLETLAGQWSAPAQKLSDMWTAASQPPGSRPSQASNTQISTGQFSHSLKRRSDQWQSSAAASQKAARSHSQKVFSSSQRTPAEPPASQFAPSSFLSSQARVAPPVAHTLSGSMDAFAFASQSHTRTGRSQPSLSQAKKKKTRKSGF